MGLLIYWWNSPFNLSSSVGFSITLISSIIFSPLVSGHVFLHLPGSPAAQAPPRPGRFSKPWDDCPGLLTALQCRANTLRRPPLSTLPILSRVILFLLCPVQHPGSLVPQTCHTISHHRPSVGLEHSHPVFAWLASLPLVIVFPLKCAPPAPNFSPTATCPLLCGPSTTWKSNFHLCAHLFSIYLLSPGCKPRRTACF